MQAELNRKETDSLLDRYEMSGQLTRKKLIEYLPAMLLTNLSTLLLVSVDGVVVGNFLGEGALSSVNIFYPSTLLIGVISTLAAAGIGTALSVAMGNSDQKKLMRLKSASLRLMIIAAIFVSVVQIPIVSWLINSYDVSPEMKDLTWQYAIGVMIASPFGLVSFVGVYQLQIVGKVKELMYLSIIEGVVNFILDVLFVGVMDIGVGGAGYGTMCANITRCTLTILYLARRTDIYNSSGHRAGAEEYKSIITEGLPEAANALMLAVQNHFMLQIILSIFGESGGAIKGVCVFALSIAMVFINGMQGAARPLMGLLSGADDRKGVHMLMRQSNRILAALLGIFILIIEFFPSLFFSFMGISSIPAGGIDSIRLYAFYFPVLGIDTLFRLYFTNHDESSFSTAVTVAGNLALPVIAWGISLMAPAPWIWTSYILTKLIILVMYTVRYLKMLKADLMRAKERLGELHLSVGPDEAVEASRAMRRYADSIGAEHRYSYRAALCLEEMVAYAVKSQKSRSLNIQIMMKFYEDGLLFMMLDDGRCISLDKNEETQKLITSNYGLLKKVAKSVEYQYVLDMNYTVFRF